MTREDIKGLKYYIALCLVMVSFYAYSGMIGWKWFNPTQTEHVRGERNTRPGHVYRYYHK